MSLELNNVHFLGIPSHCKVGENMKISGNFFMEGHEEFNSGVYIFPGDITKGNWTITYGLKTGKKLLLNDSWIKWEGKQITPKELEKMVFYVADFNSMNKDCRYIFSKIHGMPWGRERRMNIENLTMRDIVDRLRKERKNTNISELLLGFDIDENTAEFKEIKIIDLENQIWKYSVFIGLALGMKIFVFPWLPVFIADKIKIDIIRIGKIINKYGGYLFLPLEEDLDFFEGRLVYERCLSSRVCGEKLKRIKIKA